MPNFLKPKYAKPIEREYEAWIIAGIERYFRSMGVPYAVWAVSPYDETKWPADEALGVAEKVVGLQFKQAKLGTAGGEVSFKQLNWSFNQPPAQYPLILNKQEIFYCLPTFINRSVKEEALQHCLFWRPSPGPDRSGWYDNPRATTTHNPLKEAMRWGLFVELLSACKIGREVKSKEARMEVYAELVAALRDGLEIPPNDVEQPEGDIVPQGGGGLYLLAFALPTQDAP